jgi:hypothetical protein
LVEDGINRDLRRVKNWEVKILVQHQETLLANKFKMPKKLLNLAWCCFILWVVGMITIMFLWGVSMDNDATDYPSENIVSAATSNCPLRKTVANGDELNIDIKADNAFNLLGAQSNADEVNKNFTRYGNILPGWLTPPDLDFMPKTAPESTRFLVSSLTSWVGGTVVIPPLHHIITTCILALIYNNESERLKYLHEQKVHFRHTDINNYNEDDQFFFICCWPAAIIAILAEETEEEHLVKLKLDIRTTFDKALEVLAKKL